ncbi:MAG: prepilin peptidase [Oceanococcaceae bacterium]
MSDSSYFELLSEYWLPLCAVLGLLVGSFLNVVILRLPKAMEAQWKRDAAEYLELDPPADSQAPGLVFPASHCPSCGNSLRWWHNIPVLSYVLLRGRCAYCKSAISIQYPVIEVLAAILAVWAGLHFGLNWQGITAIGLGWALLTLTVIDQRTQLLPDVIVLPLLWAGLLINIQGTFVPLEDAVIGAAAGYLSLWLVYQIFLKLTGKHGMGFGDFKLLAALGAWMGWASLPWIVLLSSVVGLAWALVLMIVGRMDRGQPMPFGPFLAVAGWIQLVQSDLIPRLLS